MAQQEISQDALIIGAPLTSHVDVSQDALILCVLLTDYTIAVAPSSETIEASGSATYIVTVSALNGFTGVVTLAASGPPAGAVAAFSPATVTGSGTSTLTITTLITTPLGTSALTITGTSGFSTHSTGVTLVVAGYTPYKVILTGGAFTDFMGRPIANGLLTMKLSEDATSPAGQICAGITIKIPLDVNGNVSGTPSVAANDTMNPNTTTYTVNVYAADGQLVWGPLQATVPSGIVPFNVSSWVPSIWG